MMKRILFLSVAVALIPAGSVGQSDAPPADVVREREIAFAKTMADRDHDAFRSFLSRETVFFSGDAPIRGADAVADAWARFYEGEDPPFSWHPDLVEVLESGTLALSSGPVRGPDGAVVGRFNSVWRLESDGEWRVVFDKGCP